MISAQIPYQKIVDYFKQSEGCNLVNALLDELPYQWVDAYQDMTPRPMDLRRISRESFEFIYDDYMSIENSGRVERNPVDEARVVAVVGLSQPGTSGRGDSRLRRWVGPTESLLGKAWDKGHFVGHALGGRVDRWELNIFWHRRDLNRGWSEQGKLFRKMEGYCALHPGTLCFHRPIYTDGSARPAYLDFGLLTQEGQLWVETFENC